MHGQAVNPAVGNVPSSQAVMMTSPNTGMNSSSAAAVGGLKMVANGPDLMVSKGNEPQIMQESSYF